ncbi:uncharacterized protein CLUP02_01021 [Colletotrichum lupini]|uniref:Uncharacterized protein n=1 Tax=Colletotrichum lupini TaxID=145971 RepID=A0A9Q8SC69_9PEZI|nr:uncharacterized protein CLUP02_01021 [Colletotrichum lupini]UQC74373.1 hypothetical protein CLUP02_01021 [Colletotrichum lupini]
MYVDAILGHRTAPEKCYVSQAAVLRLDADKGPFCLPDATAVGLLCFFNHESEHLHGVSRNSFGRYLPTYGYTAPPLPRSWDTLRQAAGRARRRYLQVQHVPVPSFLSSVKTKQSIVETNTKAVKQTLRPICPSRPFDTFPGPRTIPSSVVVHCHCQRQCLAVADATADKPSPRSRHRPKLAHPESRSTFPRPPFKLDELAHGFRKLEGRPT